jgi:hypothetical protein
MMRLIMRISKIFPDLQESPANTKNVWIFVVPAWIAGTQNTGM